MFRIQFFFPVDDSVACAEILYQDEFVASVYEKLDGWKIDLFQAPRGLDLEECLKAIALAKERLLEYVNRRGENPPEGLTAAGLSLRLSEKADGTAMGKNIRESRD